MGDRDVTTGKFQPGNKGGPGRPKRTTEAAYLDATIGGVTLAAWSVVVARALADAQGGDAKARDWLSQYLLPRPADLAAIRGATAEAAPSIDWSRLTAEQLATATEILNVLDAPPPA